MESFPSVDMVTGFPIWVGSIKFLYNSLTDVIAQIKEDQQSKELLRSLIDDERSSFTWLQEACETMSAAKTA